MESIQIRDTGWKRFGSGIRDGNDSDPGSRMEKSRIRDKHPGSATLFFDVQNKIKLFAQI
jgi:hypothetical protein